MTGEHAQGWARIDPLILAGEAGAALASIRRWGAPMDIGEALEVFDERYAHLRATRPEDFTVPEDFTADADGGGGPDVLG